MKINKTYIYADSQILVQHDGSYTSPRYFYLHDRLGSVRLVAKQTIPFKYNWDGKLRSAAIDGNSISIKYDPAGNRIQKNSTVNGNRKYIVDIIGELPTILLEINPANGDIMKTYIYADSQILAQHNGNYNAPRYFYLHDRLGSVRLVIDTSGVVKNSYTYNAFGESFPTECNEAVSNPFKFSGQFFDDEIGQYYLRARQYDLYISRFTSRDPVFGKFDEPLTLHKYLYCTNDPINKVDLTGLWESGFRNHHRGDPWWYGHSDMGYGIDNFHYESLDYGITSPYVSTELHFLDLEQAQAYTYCAILSMNPTLFGYAGHMGQDYFSHRGKGYTPASHAYEDVSGWLSGDSSRSPDYPYVDRNKKRLSIEYKEADKWTKRMEDIWYLFQDPFKWIGASD